MAYGYSNQKAPTMKLIKRFAALIACSLLSGCLVNSLIYKHLDWLILYQIDRYLDLSSEQKHKIEGPIEATVTWLKTERLGEVIELLRQDLLTTEKRKFDSSSYDQWLNIFAENRRLIAEKLIPIAAPLAAELSEDQIGHLQHKLGHWNRPLEKVVKSDDKDFEDVLEDYADTSLDRLESMFGPLRRDQMELIVKKLEWTHEGLRDELRIRTNVQNEWLKLLRSHDQVRLVAAMRQANGLDPAADQLTEYYQFQQRSRTLWRNMRVSLEPTLDEKQWQHLQHAFKDLLTELERLTSKTVNR